MSINYFSSKGYPTSLEQLSATYAADGYMDAGRFWMLTLTTSPDIRVHDIAFLESGGCCLGVDTLPDDNKTSGLFIMPCLVDSNGNPVTNTSNTSATPVFWNPKAMWMAQDSTLMAGQGFPFITMDKKWALQIKKSGSYGYGGHTSYMAQLLNVSNFDSNNTPDMFSVAQNMIVQPYHYCNIIPGNWPDLHLNSAKLQSAPALGMITTGQPPTATEKVDPKMLRYPQAGISADGIQNYIIGTFSNYGNTAIEIRSLPFDSELATTLQTSTSTCLQESPDDMQFSTPVAPGRLYCCPPGMPNSYFNARGCSTTTYQDQVAALMKPPLGRTGTRCQPGFYGTGCANKCPNNSTEENCGCFMGLVPQANGSCRLIQPSSCLNQPGLFGANLQSGTCACAKGGYGPVCGQSATAAPPDYFTTYNILLGLGGLAVVGIIALLIYSSMMKRQQQAQLAAVATKAKPGWIFGGSPSSSSSPTTTTTTTTTTPSTSIPSATIKT